MKYSLLCPSQPESSSDVLPFAAAVHDSRLHGLWVGQSLRIESHLALSFASQAGIPLGIGTALAPLRTPFDAALQARSLALLSGERISVAYGISDPQFATAVRGAWPERPGSYMEEYCRLVKELCAGETASSTFSGLETKNAILPVTSQPAHVEIGLGVVRRKMAKKASAVADFVLTWLTPLPYLETELLQDFRSSGSPRVVSMVHVAIERADRDPYILAQVGSGGHLLQPHYTEMLNYAGVKNDRSHIELGARDLVDQGVFLYGSARTIADGLLRYQRIGVDEVIINVSSVAIGYGADKALEDVYEIASAIDSAPEPEEGGSYG